MAISVEKKVGFFFVCCMIVLGVMLEVGEKWNPFEKRSNYRTFLSSVTGLKVGDPVRLAGVVAGEHALVARVRGVREVQPPLLHPAVEIGRADGVRPGEQRLPRRHHADGRILLGDAVARDRERVRPEIPERAVGGRVVLHDERAARFDPAQQARL